MLLAVDYLSKGSYRISEIAILPRYESESTFSIAFKRVMGSAPKKYLLKMQSETVLANLSSGHR